MQIFGSEPERMARAAQMVVEAGADIVDINFGCPVRKVTKTGAGASALEDHDLACRLAGAVVDAVDVPVTVKMRRGERERLAARSSSARAWPTGWPALTLHPRSAQQMYTGLADHSLTAELVRAVDVPVIASGDIVDTPPPSACWTTTGAAAVMVGRGAQGRPWMLRELAERTTSRRPSRAEVVAELVRFMREVVQGDGRGARRRFLRKFYGWYLRGLEGAKELRV